VIVSVHSARNISDDNILTGARYEFARSIGSTSVPSLIPEAHLSVLPYLALPADVLRHRAVELQQDMGVFGMTFHPDGRAEELGGKIEAIEADGLIGINNTDFMVGYMSPRW
jgi:beta-1,2-xylosyltransferase